ncbi:MAG TPA: ankyrin repeat domain-containing protein [Hyphomonadaceae bacterium]|nr:ankyrin repeat domain-containing protein [Hyphomonadaceae bacterium]
MHTLDERLFQAVSDGDLESARQALDCGAAADARDGGSTALFIAALRRRVGIASLLLERGADIRARRLQTGETPLHAAVTLAAFGPSMKEMAGLLLRAGADPTALDYGGRQPIDSAIEAAEVRSPDLGDVMALLQAGKEIDFDSACRAVRLGHPELLAVIALIRAHEQARSLAVALDAQLPKSAATQTRGRL